MQRDEFLPLRVIRQELASGGRKDARGGGRVAAARGQRRRRQGSLLELEELVDQTGVAPDLIAELEEWRIVQPEQIEGQQLYDETDREIVKACGELARFGVAGRNLRVLRTVGRPRGAAARAGGRAGASLEQPQPPRGGDREPRDPRGDLQQPHPPAAGARPAQADGRGVASGQRVPDVSRRRRIDAPPGGSGPSSPTPTTCRAGGRARSGSRTSARAAPTGPRGPRCSRPRTAAAIRADYRCVSAATDERYVFEQLLEGTPFEGFLRAPAPRSGSSPRTRGPRSPWSASSELRGLSRLGGFMMRRATGRTLSRR